MKPLNETTRRERGTTLVELLIALVLTGVVTLAIMKTYVAQHENYLIQDDVTNMQQNARSCIDELARQIRMAGHNLPLGMPGIVASNTNPDTIMVTYHGNDCETFLTAKMASTSAGLVCDDVSGFRPQQKVYVFDPDSAMGEWFQISSVAAGSNVLAHVSPANLSMQYEANSIVRALNQLKFFIDQSADPEKPMLMIQINGYPAQPYAEYISDLQFTYRLSSGTIVDEPTLVTDVCEVLISIEAASYRPGSDEDGQSGDDKKRRVYNSSVSLRNMGA
jgi:Tfp pilus assembly protein PilE